jgi:hypothetical protein
VGIGFTENRENRNKWLIFGLKLKIQILRMKTS